MRLLVLHARAHRFPMVAASLLVTAVVTAAWVQSLSTDANPEFVWAAATVIAGSICTATFLSHDMQLDKSAAIRWAPWRLALLVSSVTAVNLTFFISGAASNAEPAIVLRGSLGVIGLYAVAVAIAGARNGWVIPGIYLLTAILLAGRPHLAGATWWGWIAQPGDAAGAWIAALTLFAIGATVFPACGPRLRFGADS